MRGIGYRLLLTDDNVSTVELGVTKHCYGSRILDDINHTESTHYIEVFPFRLVTLMRLYYVGTKTRVRVRMDNVIRTEGRKRTGCIA